MNNNFRILLVEDAESFRGAVKQLLGVYNDVDEADSLASARRALQAHLYDVVVLDKGLPDGDGISLIDEIKEQAPNTVVIVLTSDSDFGSIRHCITRGADDYVIKTENVVPDLLVRIPVTVSKAASHRHLKYLEQQVKEAFRYEIVGKSPSTMQLRETILGLKGSGAHVLITGESGTGKELVARRLHAVEGGKRPFVAINCGAIHENLIESELFGHKKGAFTGAIQDRIGQLEAANNGDVFFDEIGELPLTAQAKLLRFIQEGEFTRVGENRVIHVKVRVIAATNQNLEKMVSTGLFREDLYHRLNVVRITTACLRGRLEDIPDLAQLFVLQIGGPNFKIGDRAQYALKNYDWPGNIRELRNAIERSVISARQRKSFEVGYDDIIIHNTMKGPAYELRKIEASLPAKVADLTPKNYRDFLEAAEKAYFQSALEAAGGNAEDLAHRIDLGRSTIFKKIKDLGCKEKSFPRRIT
jgi:DNA-binding NtrC family response regulator